MRDLPPLECLRFFEAAGRRESFTKAAEELDVTPAAVAHRIKVLEQHLNGSLFERRRRGVSLNTHGKALLREVQHILADIHDATERYRSESVQRRIRIFSVESVADKWLVPRLGAFTASHPNVAIVLETNHRLIDPTHRDFDAWITCERQSRESGLDTARVHGMMVETLFEELLLPVCSPRLLETRGRPPQPSDLDGWPLLYDLEWDLAWHEWFETQGAPPPNMSAASGFRDYGMMVDACIQGLGAALGRTKVLESELARGALVPMFDRKHALPARCFLVTTADSRRVPEVQAFRNWTLAEARSERRPGVAVGVG